MSDYLTILVGRVNVLVITALDRGCNLSRLYDYALVRGAAYGTFFCTLS